MLLIPKIIQFAGSLGNFEYFTIFDAWTNSRVWISDNGVSSTFEFKIGENVVYSHRLDDSFDSTEVLKTKGSEETLEEYMFLKMGRMVGNN